MAIEIGIQQLSTQFALGLQQITNTLKQELNVISNTLVQEISVVNHLRQNVEVTRNTLLSSNKAHYTYIETLNQVQGKAAQVESSTSRIGGAISQVASKLFDFVQSSLGSLKDLKAGPDALGVVTDEQAQTAKDYQTSMEKLDKVLDGVKTRVGLGLAPQLSFLADRFLAVVDANKELITEGLQKTMTLVAEGLDAVYNFGRALDFVVSGTVGWDNALMMLGTALLWVGRASLMAFATNPIMWIIAALVVVIALVDDFMTYLDGGESAFGSVWEPLVKGFKEVGAILADMKAQFDAFWAENGETVMAFADGLMMFIGAGISNVINLFKGFFALLRGDFDGVKEAFGGIFEGLATQFEVIGSLFSWEPLLNGIAAVEAVLNGLKAQFMAFWTEGSESVMAFGEGLMVVIGASISNLFNLLKGIFALITGDFDGLKEAFNGWFEGVAAQFEVLSAGFKKVAGMFGFGGDKEGAPEAAKESSGMFSGVANLFGWNSTDDQAATAPRLVEGASQFTAGVQDAQSRAALGAGVGAAALVAPVSNNSFNQSVTVHVSGDNPQAIGREVAEQVASNQQRLATHNNQSDIRQ
ncbi:hypothetical protein N5C55_14240 [Pseudomonas otitidis]|uniref:hypothetical protein n=1 Tax=Metapseudomonas otitidis TaxID=319939 RepID=UPI00244A61D6|nr:hypothetical protein [Pseudomonas otitidis]MDH1106741.1 hypothetical protein [Pseudomonas otitidis]MDH1159331.1 hypothetical protein [Pseudomonas otitidis]MDH1163743.1 hypothetical protein [Pseudomonas otitidis]